MPSRVYYSMIVYRPDPVRGEFLNIGMIAVHPETETFMYELYINEERMKIFDDSFSEDHLRGIRYKLNEWEDDLKEGKLQRAVILEREEMFVDVPITSKEFLNEMCRRHSGPYNKVLFTNPSVVEFQADSITKEDVEHAFKNIMNSTVYPKKNESSVLE